jgi:capsular exopolysaccharide synthesis family protein
MRPLDYVRVVRQRWWVVALCTLLGLMLAYATAPRPSAASKRNAAPTVTYQASTLLLNNSDSPTIDYDRAALYTTHGEVVDDVVAQLKTSRTHPYVRAADLKACNSSSSSSSSSSSGKKGTSNNPGQSASYCPNGSTSSGKANRQKLRNGATLAIGPFGGTQVSAQPDASTGSFKITVTDEDEKYAPYVANLFATELIKYYNKLGQAKYDSQLAALKARGATLASVEAADSARALAQPTNSALQDQLKSDSDDLAKANSDLQQLQAAGPQTSALHVFEPASVDTTTRIVGAASKTASRKQSLLLGGAVGLLIGLGILVLTEVMSARIRDVGSAEGAARLPVVAEIPVIKFSPTNRFAVLAADDPSSLVAEAYRALRTSMLSMWQRHPRVKTGPMMIGRGNGRSNGRGNGRGNGSSAPDEEIEEHGPRLRTLLITSPGPAEGKSISTANLAVTFAETGARVIVIDADFRRPTLHRYFHRSMTPNLGDLDRDCTAADLEAILQDTAIPGVRLAASAPTKSDPGQALSVAKAAAAVAQELADVVLLDSPPLLLANDSADLATAVDGTILLTRSGWTRRSGVAASADLLRRLDATVIGLVLVAAEHSKRGGYYGYYGYYGYGYGRGGDRRDASALKRLVPWSGGRRRGAEPVASSRSGRAEQQGDSGVGGLATRPPGVDDDDPWV